LWRTASTDKAVWFLLFSARVPPYLADNSASDDSDEIGGNMAYYDSDYSPFIKTFVYKKEIDWSALTDGFTFPIEHYVVFGSLAGRIMKRGEKKAVHVFFEGKMYDASINNEGFNPKFNAIHPKDILQIRYRRDLKAAIIAAFSDSYTYFLEKREVEQKLKTGKRIKLPNDKREYLAVYSTGKDDVFFMEAIYSADIAALVEKVQGREETTVEAEFNYEMEDSRATIFETERTIKIRRLNKKIGDGLKGLYNYRCQICGQAIGEQYDSHVVEAHHIRYFVSSLDNDAKNQLIVCPNHHRIIHKKNPHWNSKRLEYTYPNGLVEGLALNYHL
jgi:predicted HNH restriction endonuclease